MPDVDAALDPLRRLAERPPRPPRSVEEVAERARHLRRRRRARRGVGTLVVLLISLSGVLWANAGRDEPRAVVAGPGPARTTPPAGPLAEPEPGDPAVWTTDPSAPPSATASSFTALVTRLGCSGGTTGRILAPGVVATPDEIIVRFTAASLEPGVDTCPSNDSVRYEVDVGQAIGNRPLVDGECRPGGQAGGTSFCQGADGAVRWRPPSSAQAEIQRQAISDGVMPDLRGGDLNTLGDGTGVLFELQEVIGQQRTVNIANDAPEGTVVEQDPLPGTPLDDVTAWTLTVSAGGPVVRYVDLPDDAAAFAATLAGFDPAEPLVVRPTEFGFVYKTDRWLFGLTCAAVDRAYRTFADARYDTACPGRIDGA